MIYDGIDINAPVISHGDGGELSGSFSELSDDDMHYAGSAGELTVEFVSDHTINMGGFMAQYVCHSR